MLSCTHVVFFQPGKTDSGEEDPCSAEPAGGIQEHPLPVTDAEIQTADRGTAITSHKHNHDAHELCSFYGHVVKPEWPLTGPCELS